MESEKALINRYWPLVEAEFARIGFRDDDPLSLGFDRPFTPERFDALLAELRSVPSGVGKVGYLAHMGIDAAEVMRELKLPPPNEAL